VTEVKSHIQEARRRPRVVRAGSAESNVGLVAATRMATGQSRQLHSSMGRVVRVLPCNEGLARKSARCSAETLHEETQRISARPPVETSHLWDATGSSEVQLPVAAVDRRVQGPSVSLPFEATRQRNLDG